MTIGEILDALDGLTDEEVTEVRDRANAVLTGRWAALAAPAKAAEIEATAAERLDEVARSWHRGEHNCPGGPGRIGTLENPTPWRPAAHPHEAWPRGWHVTHTGHIYRSRVPNNRQEPPHPAWDDLGPLEDA